MIAKSNLKQLFYLFFPIFLTISLQNISLTLDSVMVNQYNNQGSQAIGIASSIINIIGPVFFAIATGINSFSVQYYAAKKYQLLKQLIGIACSIIIPISGLCFIIFQNTQALIMSNLVALNTSIGQLSLQYFDILKWSIIFLPFEILFTNQYRAIKKPHVSLIIGIIQIIANILGNILFIYYFNLGVAGAALATVLSKALYVFINIIYSIYIKSPFIGSFQEMFCFPKTLFKKVLITIMPLLIVEFLYGSSKFLLTKIFLLTGTLGYGAYIIANRITMTFNGLVIASSQLSGIVMGEKIVSQQEHLIKSQLYILIKFLLIIASILLLSIFFIMPLMINIFNINDNNEINLIKILIIIQGLYMVLRIPVASMISILKSGGDNRFVVLLDAGITYIFTLPLMYFLVSNNFSIIIVSMILLCDMIIKIIIGLLRIKSGKWNNLL